MSGTSIIANISMSLIQHFEGDLLSLENHHPQTPEYRINPVYVNNHKCRSMCPRVIACFRSIPVH